MTEQKITKELLGDPLWRMNNLYYITDKTGHKVKFNLNWAQEELYKDMHYCNIILKARQLGISTFVCILFLDRALFNDNTAAAIISHTRIDAEHMFKRIKYAYDNLPQLIKDLVTSEVNSAQDLIFNNYSSIRVGTSLRGNTFQYLHISEFGKICAKYPDKALEIVNGTLNTIAPGQYIFIESTAEGRSGKFYELCREAEESKIANKRLSVMDYKFFFFPWWRAPEYSIDPTDVIISPDMEEYFEGLRNDYKINLLRDQKAWYAAKSRIQGDSMMQEYPSTPQESFFTSNEGLYYGRQMVKVRLENRMRKVHYDEQLPVYLAMDIGYSDTNALWFYQKVHSEIRILEYYENSQKPLPFYIKYVKEKPYVIARWFAPHDAKVTEYSSGLSRVEAARKLGVNFYVLPRLEVMDGINAVRTVLDRCYFDEEKCSTGIKCLENYSKQWNNTHACWNDKPKHDQFSHGADAFRYLVQSLDLGDSGYSLEKHRELKAMHNPQFRANNNSILGN